MPVIPIHRALKHEDHKINLDYTVDPVAKKNPSGVSHRNWKIQYKTLCKISKHLLNS